VELLAARHIPQPRGLVVAGRDDGLPIGGKLRARDRARMAAQDVELLAAGDIPQARGLVCLKGPATRGDDGLAVGGKLGAVDRARMAA